MDNDYRIPAEFLDCLARSRIGAALLDSAGRVVAVNSVVECLPARSVEILTLGVVGDACCRKHDSAEPYPADELPLARALRGEIVNDCLVVLHFRDRPEPLTLSVSASPFRGGLFITMIRDVGTRDALLEAESRFQTITEAVPFTIWTTTPDGACDFVNRAAVELTGRSVHQQLGWLWRDLLHPGDVARFLKETGEAMGRRDPIQIEYRVRRADGSDCWLFMRGQPRFTAAGAFAGYVVSAADVTEHRRLEQALSLSEQRYRELYEGLPVGVFRTTPDGHVLEANPATRRILGTADEAPFDEISAEQLYVNPADRRRFLDLMDANDGPVSIETEFRGPGGNIISVRITGQARRKAGLCCYDGIIEDITQRKQVQDALRNSEHRYRMLFDSMAQGVLCRDLDGRILAANPAAERMLGGWPEGLVGVRGVHARLAVLDPDGSELPRDKWPWKVAATTGRKVENVLVRTRDTETAEERWLKIDAVPQFHPADNVPSQIFVFLEDVTEREQSRRALQRQKDLLETIFDSLPVLIGTVDPDTGLVQVNRAWARLLGPEDSAASQALLACPHADMKWGETTISRPDGRAIDVDCMRVPLGDGTRLVIARDVTGRNAAGRLLRASEERFRALIENSSEVIIVLDENATMRYVSRASARAAGLDPDAMTGDSAFARVHPDDVAATRQAIDSALHSPGARVTFDVRVRDVGGRWRVWEDTITNMLDVKGVGGLVLNCRDITERKQMESELRESRDRLRQLNARIESVREQERTRIAREVHDELGQMLTALKMELQTLGMREARQGAARDTLSRIDAMAGHIDETINSVRRISSELRPGLLDHLGLGAAIGWQAGEFQNRTGILCATSIPDNEPKLTPEQATGVFRVFQEILTNIARHAQATSVAIRLAEDDCWLTLEVEDNGRGIEPDRISDGAALGLLGMRERAALLGGTVEFEGVRGQGTLVRVRIPLRESSGPPIHADECA